MHIFADNESPETRYSISLADRVHKQGVSSDITQLYCY